jgi:tRNA 2-thiouridine synthesizing protein A
MDEVLIDTRGLNCPLPVLRARKAMRGLAAGTRVRLIATDPGALRDVEEMCNASGERLVDSGRAGEELHFLIDKR